MGSPVSDDKNLGGNKDFDIEDEPSEFDGDGFDGNGFDGKPFDDEPFDAGVEADEEESPEKFIQQLSGKLGQSLRKYTEDSGEPNFDLEKFAINSVISATNTSKMDQQDQSDIIAKVKSSSTNKTQNNDNELNDMGDSPNDEDSETDFSDEGGFDLSNVDVEESHNPNGNKKTVFKNQSLGVKNGGMEENKYLKLENSNKINTYPEKWLEKIIKSVIQETFYEPITKPKVQPIVKPIERPSRRKKPYTIIPEQLPNPKPKAEKKKGDVTYIKDSGFSEDGNSITIKFDVEGEKRFVANFINKDKIKNNSNNSIDTYIYRTDILDNNKQYYIEVNKNDYLGEPIFTNGDKPIIHLV